MGNAHDRAATLAQQHFGDFDILILQEVWAILTCEIVDTMITYGQKAGLIYYSIGGDAAKPGILDPYVSNSGLLILSRFPIRREHFHSFSATRFIDCEANRGVQHALIEIGEGKFLNLFNLHTMSNNLKTPENFQKSIDIRY